DRWTQPLPQSWGLALEASQRPGVWKAPTVDYSALPNGEHVNRLTRNAHRSPFLSKSHHLFLARPANRIRLHVGTTFAAGLANEPRLDIGNRSSTGLLYRNLSRICIAYRDTLAHPAGFLL